MFLSGETKRGYHSCLRYLEGSSWEKESGVLMFWPQTGARRCPEALGPARGSPATFLPAPTPPVPCLNSRGGQPVRNLEQSDILQILSKTGHSVFLGMVH